MSAYPFQQAQRYGDFIDSLKKVGVEVKERKPKHAGDLNFLYLSNMVSGQTFYYPLTFASPDERVQLTVLRMVCTALRIDPASFGLHMETQTETPSSQAS